VLATEDGQVGLHDVEELEHDGGHAVEVGGAALAFQRFGHAAERHRRHRTRRIDLLDAGKEKEIDRARLEQLAIARLVARVAPEVLARTELLRIDEDGNDDELRAVPARDVDQREMPFVKEAHRRHEADRGLGRQGVARFFDRVGDDHFFGISTTFAEPYSDRSSSAFAMWNDSLSSSGKRPARMSST